MYIYTHVYTYRHVQRYYKLMFNNLHSLEFLEKKIVNHFSNMIWLCSEF